MDFRSICQKIDVDSFKAKLPVLPPMPALPQLKLPKLKSRKIFRSSCENVNETDKTPPGSQTATSMAQQQQQQQQPVSSIPRANFIDYTPNHISTVSSLMHEYSLDGTDPSKKSTYRSACSVDDDYPSSTQPSGSAANMRTSDPISQSQMPPKVNSQELSSQNAGSTNTVAHLSITERIQKGYKDVSEFRIKHIFAKKTVVRKDNIKVDDYVLQYDAERLQEQVERERYDRDIAENYKINFKLATTRQNTIESNDSLDETHSSSLSKAIASNESADGGCKKINEMQAKLPDITTVAPSTEGKESADKTSACEKKSMKLSSEYKNRLRRLKKYLSSTDENINEAANQTAEVETDTKSAKLNREGSLHKANDQRASQQSVEHLDSNETPLNSIKQNIKRFHKSIKQSHLLQSTQSTAGESSRSENKHIESERPIKSTRRENLRSSKSVEEISGQSEQTSGFRKFQTWKTSLEKQASRAVSGSIIGFKGSPPQTHNSQEVFPNGLFKKIKCICSRKSCNTNEEVDNNECKEKEHETVVPKIEQREVNQELYFSEEQMEQTEEEDHVGNFHENEEVVCVLLDDDDDTDTHIGQHCFTASDTDKNDITEYTTSIKSEYIEKHNCSSNQLATWTTKSILCERSIEPEEESTFSQVYLHQDSSDAYRSTLIVAVTRPESVTHSPQLREIMPEDEMPITSVLRSPNTYSTESIPYEHITPNYLNKTYPYKHKTNKQLAAHNRSADSNSDLKMWTINQENLECEPRLIYKTKNIDIFDKNEDRRYSPAVFEDFDEELCNEPIVLIATDRGYCDQDSSDDADSFNNDNLSHVTKICVPAIIETKSEIIEESLCQQVNNENLTNNRASQLVELDTKLETNKDLKDDDDDEEEEDDDNDDGDDDVFNKRPFTPESSPPTSCSPIPPPLPERRQPILPKNEEYYVIADPVVTPLADNDCLPPTLPNSKPPEPSLNTPLFKCTEGPILTAQKSKPLVKTSSLRLAFNEQVRPSDIGKVNKLISRFEQPGSKSFDRSIATISRHRSQHSVEEEYSDNEIEETANRVASFEVHDVNQIIPVSTSNVMIVKHPTNSSNDEKTLGTDNNEPKPLEKGGSSSNSSLLKIPEISHFSDKHKTTHNLDRKNTNSGHIEHESTLSVPSQLLGVNKTATESDRKHLQQYQLEHQQRYARRSRRSMTRDDENFYSFDSDEENSYYSISPSGSSRFVVDI